MKRICIIGLTSVVLALQVKAVRAQSRIAEALSPKLGHLTSQMEYEVYAITDESVSKQKVDLSFIRQSLGVRLPLLQSEHFESALQSNIEVMDLATRAQLTDTGVSLPDHLWSLDLGGRLRRQWDNHWITGLQVSLGSPSDKPFDSWDETSLNVTGTLQIPTAHKNHHVFFLNYATNREFLPHVPIPGYAYQWSSHRTVQALLGLPFCWARWSPTDGLTLQGAYFIPRTIHTQISYELVDDWTVYTGFDWRNQRWFRAGREDNDERIFYYEKKVHLGLRWDILSYTTIDLRTGYGFDRFFFEGEDYDDRRNTRLAFTDGWFSGAHISIRY